MTGQPEWDNTDYLRDCQWLGIDRSQILLSDRITKFFDWLEANTDFSEWDDKVKMEAQKKLIEIMTER